MPARMVGVAARLLGSQPKLAHGHVHDGPELVNVLKQEPVQHTDTAQRPQHVQLSRQKQSPGNQ